MNPHQVVDEDFVFCDILKFPKHDHQALSLLSAHQVTGQPPRCYLTRCTYLFKVFSFILFTQFDKDKLSSQVEAGFLNISYLDLKQSDFKIQRFSRSSTLEFLGWTKS
nr:Biomphalaria glabrata cadherin-related family member 1-like [Biomphalaria glabrata]